MPDDLFVRDFMTSPATSLSYRASLLDAALMIRRTGFRHIPVVDGDRLLGIITDRDVNRLAPSRLEKITPEEYNAILKNTLLETVMTRSPISVTPDSLVVEAVAILHQKKLGCLPVVQGDRLIGIITVTDMLALLRWLLGGKMASAFELEGT